jgi:hypothetical protein
MLKVVAPVLHVIIPLQFPAVNIAVWLGHRVVLSAIITGTVGAVFTIITTGTDIGLIPQLFVHVAV